jgi:lipoate---protein ligase
MLYIESRNTNPHHNLAMEQLVFEKLGGENDCFMLWQNNNSIIIGRHQNTLEEIDSDFVRENNITVARRLSGGGAVYHDLGNLNFTFITAADKQKGIDFSAFCEPIREALCSLGVPVEFSGRNDMTVEGKKFSGNAQYVKDGKVMHHGTILYDSDLYILSQALKPPSDKIESRGIKSVKSRVTNIRPYMKADMPVTDFWAALENYFFKAFNMREFALSPAYNAEVEELRRKIYSRWSWNYGNSPPYSLRKVRRIEGCGKIEILLDVAKDGIIKDIAFYGDFFGNRELSELGEKLIGLHFEHGELTAALEKLDFSEYIYNLTMKDFLELLF